MALEPIRVQGNAGMRDPRTVSGDDVRARIVAFVTTPTSQLNVMTDSIGLTREYNGTWTFRFEAEARDPAGATLGRRHFQGRYDPESGGIDLRERTRAVFAVNYYKDTR